MKETRELREEPGKRMRWGVPDGTRDEATGELVHDDLLVSAAMCIQSARLDLGVYCVNSTTNKLRSLRKSMDACKDCDMQGNCPILRDFSAQINTAIHEVTEEWGLSL